MVEIQTLKGNIYKKDEALEKADTELREAKEAALAAQVCAEPCPEERAGFRARGGGPCACSALGMGGVRAGEARACRRPAGVQAEGPQSQAARQPRPTS